jgi:hypothetical protein
LKLPTLPPRLARLALVALVLSVGLAAGSVGIHRQGPERGVVGHVCGRTGAEPCYGKLLNGGFPLGFLIDVPEAPSPDRLGPEDRLRPLHFLGDVVFFWSLLAVAWRVGRARRRHMKDLMPRRRRAR